MFHRHKWKESERFYAPPTSRIIDVLGFDAERFLERSIHGITTVLYTCLSCGEVYTKEVLGQQIVGSLPLE